MNFAFRHIQTRRLDTRLGGFTVFDLPVDSKLKPSHSDVYSLRYGARFFRVISDLHKISRRPESEPRYLETCSALALSVASIISKFNMNISIVISLFAFPVLKMLRSEEYCVISKTILSPKAKN